MSYSQKAVGPEPQDMSESLSSRMMTESRRIEVTIVLGTGQLTWVQENGRLLFVQDADCEDGNKTNLLLYRHTKAADCRDRKQDNVDIGDQTECCGCLVSSGAVDARAVYQGIPRHFQGLAGESGCKGQANARSCDEEDAKVDGELEERDRVQAEVERQQACLGEHDAEWIDDGHGIEVDHVLEKLVDLHLVRVCAHRSVYDGP